MNNQQNLASLVGRIFIASLFIPAGLSKLMNFSGTAAYIASAGLPVPSLGVVVAIICELVLGIALLVGFKTRISALVVALFTIATALAFHPFWSAPAAQVMMQQTNFFKNIAIAGGLLAFAAFGAGAWSVDAKLGKK